MWVKFVGVSVGVGGMKKEEGRKKKRGRGVLRCGSVVRSRGWVGGGVTGLGLLTRKGVGKIVGMGGGRETNRRRRRQRREASPEPFFGHRHRHPALPSTTPLPLPSSTKPKTNASPSNRRWTRRSRNPQNPPPLPPFHRRSQLRPSFRSNLVRSGL